MHLAECFFEKLRFPDWKTVSFACLFSFVFSFLLCQPINSNELHLNVEKDSIKSLPDESATQFQKEYLSYKLKKLSNNNLLKLNIRFNLNLSLDHLTDIELYKLSKELYNRYYLRKIELLNYHNIAFLYLDIKELQSTKGLLQMRVNFSNFNHVFSKKHITYEE